MKVKTQTIESYYLSDEISSVSFDDLSGMHIPEKLDSEETSQQDIVSALNGMIDILSTMVTVKQC